MRAGLVFVAVILCVGSSMAQETPMYRNSDNPYQEDLPFAAGQPVALQVDVQGVRFSSLAVVPQGDVQAGTSVACEATLSGANQREGKVAIAAVLLLEDAQGKGIERVQFEPFKAKAGRDFTSASKVAVQGDSLLGARRVYVFIEVVD